MSMINKEISDFTAQACRFVAQHGGEVCPANWQPGSETLRPSLDLVGLI